MERVLRCTLVDRNTRGGVLTESGVRALERVRPAMHAIDLVPEVVSVAPHLPVIRIGILRLAGISILPDLIQRWRKVGQLPRLQLHEGAVVTLMEQLQAGEIDCIIGRLEPDHRGQSARHLDITQLQDDPYELACAPGNPLARRRAVALADLLDAPWVVAPRSTYTRQAFEMAFMSQGMPAPVPMVESPSFHASFAVIARQTDFITIAPSSAVRYYAGLGIVRPIRLATPFPPDRMVFVTRTDLLGMPAMAEMRRQLESLAST